MASKGKKTPRELAIDGLNRITRDKPHPGDLWSVIIEAEDSLILEGLSVHVEPPSPLARAVFQGLAIPDATFALVVSTAIEQILEAAISTHFVLDYAGAQRMFDDNSNGPISSFAAKIKTGYALGIYPFSIKEELDLIRHIRNAFAHSFDKLDFTNQAVAEGCLRLRLPQFHAPNPLAKKVEFTPKSRFLFSARYLYILLDWNDDKPVLMQDHPQWNFYKQVQEAFESERASQSR